MIYSWLNIIAAMTYRDNVIGLYNDLPWPKLMQDMKNFANLTKSHIVVMGQKTFNSLNKTPLPNRFNIVLTSNIKTEEINKKNLIKDNSVNLAFINSVDSCIETLLDISGIVDNTKKVWIIGGSQIYRQFLPYVNKLYLTVIYQKLYGDKHFPDINPKEWELESIEEIRNDVLSYDFQVWKRKIVL